jgi:ELWxxDGT repeat protein
MASPRHANRATTEILEPRRLLAAQVVADLDSFPADSFPSHLTTHGDTLYFFATDTAAGRELWKTDGTVAGTVRVTDLNPGPGNAVNPFSGPGPNTFPEEIASSGGRLFFTATRGTPPGTGLFLTDGTAAGTAPVKDLNPAADDRPVGLTDVDGRLFFMNLAGTPRGVWKTDGTEAGTVQLGTFPNAVHEGRSRPAASGGLYYFVAQHPVHGLQLWKSDGTPEGTGVVKNIGFTNQISERTAPGWLTDVDGTLFFYAYENPNGSPPSLWKTDGTEAGTTLVKRGVLDDETPASRPARVGNTLYFFGAAGLWKTDGTEAGTVEVRPSSVAGSLTNISNLAAVGDRLFFFRYVTGSPELWTSDGTPEGTVRAASNFLPGVGVLTNELAAIGGRLFFAVVSLGDARRSLWASDGTAAGTVQVADIQPPAGARVQFPEFTIGAFGGAAWFPARDAAAGIELWRSDGTPAATSRFKNLDPATPSLRFGHVATRGGALFVSPTSGPNAGDLLMTDGTGAPVVLREGAGPARGADWLTTVGDTVFFVSVDTGYQRGLWKTDGTPAGTVLVSTLGSPTIEPYGLVESGGKLFFVVVKGTEFQLWRSDGTTGGTVKLMGGQTAWSTDGRTVGDTFFVPANGNDGAGVELWKTDGTPAGTSLVIDLAPGPFSSAPRNLTPLGDALLFTAKTTEPAGAPDQLWRTDGTAEGTVALTAPGVGFQYMPGELGTFAGHAYFGTRDPAPGSAAALWKSDGTPGGTGVLKELPAGFAAPDQFAVANALLFFRAADAQGDSWLWKTDGTAAGTLPVRRFESAGRLPIELAGEVGGDLHFAAEDGAGGRELWRSDGTGAGTVPAADLFPGPPGSYPQTFTPAGGALYFTAIHPQYGREFWRYTADPGQPAARVGGRHAFYNNSAFDGRDDAANEDDDRAIATGKQPLLPGQAASFDNVTSYTRGINGLLIDVADLPGAAALGAGDFVFEIASGPGNGTWIPAPAPRSVSVRGGAGVDGADRVTLTWADGAIRNTWLRVTVKANANTGLTTPDVFHFGNLVGEVGDATSPRRVGTFDLAALRRAFTRAGATAALASPYDLNRDGRVNALDLAAARTNLFQTLRTIPTPPAAITAATSFAPTPPSPRHDLPRRDAYGLPH